MGVVDQYRALLKKLLPPGAAFNRGTGTNLSSLLDGMAEEPARVHDRVGDLMLETMPDTTTEMLAEWETAWGLPDQCTGALDTLAERRAALLARMVHVGQQSPGFFVRVAATLGYSIVTEENVGGSAYVWRIVSSIITAPVYARAGSARSGDPIRTWGGDMLECAMRALNPAHLDLLFAYVEADIAPALVSATIWPDGQTLVLTFNQALSHGAGYSDSDFTIDGSLLGLGIAVAYDSGSGTGTHIYTIDGTVRVGETVTLTFTGGNTSLVRSDGAYLEPVTAMTVFNGSEVTEAPPSIVSATINAAGNQLTVVFSEAMTQGAGYQNTDMNLDGSLGGLDIGLTYVSGSGTDTWVFSIATVIRKNETVDLDYNGRPDGIEDVSGNDLAAVASLAVTNDSTEDYSDIVFWDGFEGVIDGTAYSSTDTDYPQFHTGFIASTALITPTYKKVGASCYYAPSSAGASYFPIAPFSTVRGRIGAWWRPVSLLAYRGIFGLSIGTSSDLWSIGLRVGDTADKITIMGRTDPVNEWPSVGHTITFPSPFVMNNTYFIELAWDYEAGFFTVFIDGVLVGSIDKASAQSGHFNYIFPGRNPATGASPVSCAIDNMMLSTDPNRDLYALALLEACPRV